MPIPPQGRTQQLSQYRGTGFLDSRSSMLMVGGVLVLIPGELRSGIATLTQPDQESPKSLSKATCLASAGLSPAPPVPSFSSRFGRA